MSNIVACHTKTMATIKRFRQGVHLPGSCGTNRYGYAAVLAASEHGDLHQLNNHMFHERPLTTPPGHKRGFLGSDTITYIFAKLLVSSTGPSTYIVLLSKPVNLTEVLTNMIDKATSQHSLFLWITCIDSSFHICLLFDKCKSTLVIGSQDRLIDFISSIKFSRRVSVICYPDITDVYLQLVNNIQPDLWCIPACKYYTYVSCLGPDSYANYVYPWSKSPTSRGFTAGTGPVRGSYKLEHMQYLSTFNFYESMISSVPIHGSCSDCYAMRVLADSIEQYIHPTPTKTHKHTLSSSSVDALQELQDMIQRSSAGS